MRYAHEQKTTYLQQHMKTRANATTAIIVTAITGTTIATIFPSVLNLNAGSEYGATLAMIKPFAANVLFPSYYEMHAKSIIFVT